MTEQIPEPSRNLIATNLDTVERDSVRPPFWFVIGGREITLADPANLDWQEVDGIDDEVAYLKLAMSDEDLGFFLTQKVPLWKMERLGRDYQTHYGAQEPGKAAPSGS